jgi:hypothetical protein
VRVIRFQLSSPGYRPESVTLVTTLLDAQKYSALGIGEAKWVRALGRKAHLLEGNEDSPVLRPVIISQLEVPFGERRVPPDAIE